MLCESHYFAESPTKYFHFHSKEDSIVDYGEKVRLFKLLSERRWADLATVDSAAYEISYTQLFQAAMDRFAEQPAVILSANDFELQAENSFVCGDVCYVFTFTIEGVKVKIAEY